MLLPETIKAKITLYGDFSRSSLFAQQKSLARTDLEIKTLKPSSSLAGSETLFRNLLAKLGDEYKHFMVQMCFTLEEKDYKYQYLYEIKSLGSDWKETATLALVPLLGFSVGRFLDSKKRRKDFNPCIHNAVINTFQGVL